ncbi:MAG: ABC transporter ATP-binding protein, partial [Hungatella sp.]
LVTDPSYTETMVRTELCRLLPEESITRPVSTLSGGMKRRTAICRALLAPSDIILMDEPFTGLDEQTKQQVMTYIQEKSAGKLLLISTHQEEDIALLGGILCLIS